MNEQERLHELDPEMYPDRHIRLTLDNMGVKHSIVLHRGWLIGLAVLVLAGIVLLGLFAFRQPSRSASQRLRNLEVENKFLQEQLKNYETQLDSLKSSLEKQGKLTPSQDNAADLGSGGAPDQENQLLIHPGLATLLGRIDRKIGALEICLTNTLSSGEQEVVLPQGFVTSGDGIPAINPTFGHVTDGWGTRIHPITQSLEFHTGMDIANKIGTPVYATADGVVTKARYESGYGKVIEIGHKKGYKTLYGHLSAFRIKSGDAVHKGQIIGYMGNTGYSTGSHLHYGVSRNGSELNPRSFLNRLDNTDFATL